MEIYVDRYCSTCGKETPHVLVKEDLEPEWCDDPEFGPPHLTYPFAVSCFCAKCLEDADALGILVDTFEGPVEEDAA